MFLILYKSLQALNETYQWDVYNYLWEFMTRIYF